MSPIALVSCIVLLTKMAKGGSAPAARPGQAVTSMVPGHRYTLTMLWTGAGVPDPQSLMHVSNFQTETSRVAQNADASWSGQMTGVYKGGDVVDASHQWSLLQMAAA